MTEIYAYIACAILIALTLFQVALIAGAPLGKYAWGGAHTVLPYKLRVGSAIAIALYTIFALIILNRAGVISVINGNTFSHAAMWTITAYFCLGVFMNAVSRSRHERAVMTPIALVLVIVCLMIATS